MPRAATRAKPPRTIEVVRRPVDLEQDEGEEIETQDYELAAAANQLSSVDGASVTIYRQGTHGRDLKFIDTMPPANFSMVMLKHPPYSGGIFRIQMRNAHGEMVLNRRQEVEPGPKVVEPAPAPAPVVQPLATSNEAFVLLAKAMTDGFSKLGELIVASRPEPPKARSTEEILNELTMMKGLFDRPTPSSDPIDTVTKLLGVMKELPMGGGEGGGGEPGPMMVLLELARTFGPKLMEAQQAAEAEGATGAPRALPRPRPAAQPGQPQPGQPPRVVVPPNPNQPPEERKPDVNFIIGQQIKFLLRQAQNNNDPEPYAVMVLDNVPPRVLQNFLNRADWFAEVCRYVPDAKQHQEWFDALKGHIDEYLTEEAEDTQTGGTPPADGKENGDPATGTAINVDPDTGGGAGH